MSTSLVNAGGRAGLRLDDRIVDVANASDGRFSTDPMEILGRWSEFRSWAAGLTADAPSEPVDEAKLGPPVTTPQKIFGVGLNYTDHAEEAGLDLPKEPLIFTKFPNCLVGPRADVVFTSNRVDYEVELVVVIGSGGRNIDEGSALDHVAGYCVGQDISDRRMQFAGKPPQFSMGKSVDTFGPIGPGIVSLDELADPNDLAISCDVSGERLQDARTNLMVFSVPELIAFLSKYCTLVPGDLIFTGTPAGVGSVRDPRRYLAAGDTITSTIEGLGTIVNTCVEG
ncbi:MAG: fumarylacetoacetate hydrolase family protein [Candidatus Binatia bacterium]|nr:fumarylacetoacetate hydrolase family protein [Candidatus Binatia bacterium]